VHVASPDNLEKTLELKNRSPEMRETISRYKEIQNNFEVQIDNLYVEKARLQDLLFARVHD
jgi:hypothetical protein